MVDERLHLSSVNRDTTTKPLGRDEVRAAILDAASRHFAAHGTSASLREIAADADVNLGLIHRHFGNKNDLIRAVLESHATAGVKLATNAPDMASAVAPIFEENAKGGRYIKTLAWLLLENAPLEQFQTQFPTINALRGLAADDDAELHLLAAFALIYGWTVFGEQLLVAFGHRARDRGAIEQQLVEVLRTILTPASPVT